MIRKKTLLIVIFLIVTSGACRCSGGEPASEAPLEIPPTEKGSDPPSLPNALQALPLHKIDYYLQNVCNPEGTVNDGCIVVYLSDVSHNAQSVARAVVNSRQFDRNAQLYALLLKNFAFQTGELETVGTSTFIPSPTGQSLISLLQTQYGADNACVIGESEQALLFPMSDNEGPCDAYLIGVGVNPSPIIGLDRSEVSNIHAYGDNPDPGLRFITTDNMTATLESILPGLRPSQTP